MRMQQPHEMDGRKKKKVNKKRKELSGSSGVVNKVKVTPLHQASTTTKKKRMLAVVEQRTRWLRTSREDGMR